MSFQGVLAQATVTDLAVAEPWYTTLFDREPDARPMPGLLEWHVSDQVGVQVWAEPDRAGRSSIVLSTAELDGVAQRLQAAGLARSGPEQASSSRILMLTDPDGNRVVLTGA